MRLRKKDLRARDYEGKVIADLAMRKFMPFPLSA